jgi:hypothetical protein
LFARRDGDGLGYQRWFGRVVLVGVVANIGLALPTMLRPNLVLGLLHVPLTHEPMWANFAAFLLILLTLSYIPGALDPVRCRMNAWLAVFARLTTVVFFLGTSFRHDWLLFGLIDLSFGVPQGILLVLAERAGARRSTGLRRLPDRGVVGYSSKR